MSTPTKITGLNSSTRARAVTRARVLQSAEKLFLEKGFRATSVQEIAAAAGYTTGAIYSSFHGKDDLFLAVFQVRHGRQEQVWREALKSSGSVADAAASMGAALELAVPEPAWYAVLFEFLSYAARDERLAHTTAETYRMAPSLLEDILGGFAASSPLPLDRLAQIILAVMRGLAMNWFVDAETRDTSLFSDAVAVLLGGVPAGGSEATH